MAAMPSENAMPAGMARAQVGRLPSSKAAAKPAPPAMAAVRQATPLSQPRVNWLSNAYRPT